MLTAAQPPLAATCPELAALSISLACSARVAEEMARGGRLEQLLDLAVGPAEPAPAPQQGLPEGAEAEGAQPAAALAEGGEAGGAQPPAAALPPLAAPAAAAGPLAEDELAWKLLRALGEHDSEPVRARFAPALPRMGRLVMVSLVWPASQPAGRCLQPPGALVCAPVARRSVAGLTQRACTARAADRNRNAPPGCLLDFPAAGGLAAARRVCRGAGLPLLPGHPRLPLRPAAARHAAAHFPSGPAGGQRCGGAGAGRRGAVGGAGGGGAVRGRGVRGHAGRCRAGESGCWDGTCACDVRCVQGPAL